LIKELIMRLPQPRHIVSLLVALGLLSIPVRAQSVVVPQQFDTTEAPGVAFWALGPFESRRQLIIGASHLASLRGVGLQSLSVRRNTGDNSPLSGGPLEFSVWLSHSQRAPNSVSTYFTKNSGADRTLVFGGTLIVPPSAGSPSIPAPWSAPHALQIPFTRQFVYHGGDLCIEILTKPVLGQTPPWFTIDAVVESGGGAVTEFGQSCVPQMGLTPAGADEGMLTVGSTAVFYLRGQRATGSGVCILGTSNSSFGSIALPLDLGQLGAEGCSLFTNPVAHNQLTPIMELAAGAPGYARMGLLIPRLPTLAGARLYSQWIVMDPGINPMNMTFSNGLSLTIGAPRPDWDVAWVESQLEQSPVGLLFNGRVPVLKLDG